MFHPLSYDVIGAAIEVHKALGPGFLERVYHNALECELRKRGVPYASERAVSVVYDGVEVGTHRLDLLVSDDLVVELKAVAELEKVHYGIVRSYMRAVGTDHGVILNFGQFKLEVRRVGCAAAARARA